MFDSFNYKGFKMPIINFGEKIYVYVDNKLCAFIPLKLIHSSENGVNYWYLSGNVANRGKMSFNLDGCNFFANIDMFKLYLRTNGKNGKIEFATKNLYPILESMGCYDLVLEKYSHDDSYSGFHIRKWVWNYIYGKVCETYAPIEYLYEDANGVHIKVSEKAKIYIGSGHYDIVPMFDSEDDAIAYGLGDVEEFAEMDENNSLKDFEVTISVKVKADSKEDAEKIVKNMLDSAKVK